MTPNSRRLSKAGQALLLVCLLPAIAKASSVTIVIGSVQGASGSKVEVPVNIRNAQQLGALQMDLIYDPAVLEVQSVERGSLSQEITVGSNVISPGRLRMVMNTSASESISGDGVLMRAVFLAKGQAGQSCELLLELVRAWDNTKPEAIPYEMLVTIEPGKFAVVGSPLSPTLLVALGGGAVLLILLIVALRRRRSSARSRRSRSGRCWSLYRRARPRAAATASRCSSRFPGSARPAWPAAR